MTAVDNDPLGFLLKNAPTLELISSLAKVIDMGIAMITAEVATRQKYLDQGVPIKGEVEEMFQTVANLRKDTFVDLFRILDEIGQREDSPVPLHDFFAARGITEESLTTIRLLAVIDEVNLEFWLGQR